MGLREALRGRRVYLDANVFIYLVEGSLEFEAKLAEIRQCIFHAECEFVTSELTLCEVLVRPFRQSNAALVDEFRALIERSEAFELKPTTLQTYIRASLYRAQLGLKTPDAVHMATAVESNCDVFVTNDKPMKAPQQIKMLKLREVS